MKSKTSFFNRGIFLNDIKRFGWIGVIYALTLFFAIPLKILMVYSQEEVNYNPIEQLFLLKNSEIQNVLILIIPVLIGIFLFRYIQVKSSTDMIHSLPLKRSVIYKNHILVGLILMVIPILINAFISCILNKALDLQSYYTINEVLKWAGFTLLMDFVVFFTCIFVGMTVGISILQGVITYLVMLLPAGLVLLLDYNLGFFIYGFEHDTYEILEKLSPVVRIIKGFNKKIDIGIGEIAIYIGICILLYLLAELLYKKRSLEAASQSIAFYNLQFVFKYITTFCTMLMGGFYFAQTQQNVYWVVFGYFIGATLGYFIAEMLIRKSLYVFKNIKGYLVYIGIILIVFLGIKYDFTGYQRSMPAFNDIKNVYFSYGFYNLKYEKYNMDFYSDVNNIRSIYNFHKKLIEDKDINDYTALKRESDRKDFVFIYKLKDGRTITRGYKICENDYKQYLKSIYESKEYKKSCYYVLELNSKDIDKINIEANLSNGRKTEIINSKDIEEGFDILKDEINNETYEQINSNLSPWAEVKILISDNKIDKYPLIKNIYMEDGNRPIYISWKKSYLKFEKWLTKKNYIKNARIFPEDIGYIVIEQVENKKEWDKKFQDGKFIAGKKKRLEITNKKFIEICLRKYKEVSVDNDKKYIIGFYSKNKENIGYGSFTNENLPSFVKEYFKNK